jgi:hypothetical protein
MNSIGYGIVMTTNNGHTQIARFNYSGWASNDIDHKLTTGYCMFVSGNLVSWRCKK